MELLVVEPLDPEVLDWLSMRHAVVYAPHLAHDPFEFRASLARVRGMVLPPSVAVDRAVLRAAPQLLTVGRLSADSELIALRACGVSLFAIARPLLLLGLLLTIGNTWLATRIMPAANYALQQLQIQLVTQTVAQQVEPRVIFDQFPGKTLYVFDIDRESRLWRGVVLADAVPGPRNEIIVADRGTLRLAADGEQLTLHLEEAIRHSVDFTRPDRYEVSR